MQDLLDDKANAPILSKTVDLSHQGGNLQIIFVATLEKNKSIFWLNIKFKSTFLISPTPLSFPLRFPIQSKFKIVSWVKHVGTQFFNQWECRCNFWWPIICLEFVSSLTVSVEYLKRVEHVTSKYYFIFIWFTHSINFRENCKYLR